MNIKMDLIKLISKQDIRAGESPIKPASCNASSLHELCPRYHFFATRHKDQYLTSNIISSALNITFDMGRALEHSFRIKFLEVIPITRVLGNWKISETRPLINPNMMTTQWNHETKQNEICEFGFGTEFDSLENFREIRLSGTITGRIDWAYLDDNWKITIAELKTISKTDFEKMKSAKPAHIIQALSYVRELYHYELFKGLNLELNKEAMVFYTCKDFRNRTLDERETGETPMYKVFEVDYDSHRHIMRERYESAAEAVKASTTGVKPLSRCCETYLKGRGKQCPFRVRCFMGDSDDNK